jgi:hypothetical protein
MTDCLRSLARKSNSDARDASTCGDDRALTAQAPAGGVMDPRYEFDGTNLFLLVNGERIAKRGHPRTPEAGKWIPLLNGVAIL